jgi:PKD domain
MQSISARATLRPRTVLVVVFALTALVLPGNGIGAPPTNDNFADATSVTSLPFSQTVEVTEATIETGEPVTWFGQSRSVWWSFTPAENTMIRIARAPCCYQFISVYRADSSGFDGLARISGTGDPWGTVFSLNGGTTYYVQSGDDYPYGWTTTVTLSLDEMLPPVNDDFADAKAFSEVPYSDAPDMTAATVEAGEPTTCGANVQRSAWYVFTPTTSGTYGGFAVDNVNVYTGSSLQALTAVACSEWPGLYFHADAGTTYYLQMFGTGVRVESVPPPDPGWDFTPSDPSRLDTITFRHGFGYWYPTITSYAWNFGDGTTATSSENAVNHRFATDGDYTATLTVTQRGGDTASQTHVVRVRTHDVGFLWSSVTARGRLGRSSPIQVGVGNTRYAETVRVDFYKLTPSGSVFLGTVTKPVPVMNAKKTVMFAYDYAFTNDDLAVGKVSFQAVATIEGARDAFGGDNTVTTSPTSVTR